MIVRKAEERDKEQILKLVNRLYGRSSPQSISKWQNNYCGLKDLTYIVKKDGTIIAYIAFGFKKKALYIGDLYVLPKYRRGGIASKLVEHAIEMQKKFKEIHGSDF